MHPYEAPLSQTLPEQTASELKHCGIGITGLVIAAVSMLCIFVLFGVAGYMEVTTPGGVDEESTSAIIFGLMIIGLSFLVLIALVLGIVNLFRSDRRKLFGILATTFSLFTILIVGGVIALGLAVE